MISRVAVIYATKSGILRRKIVPEVDDSELDAHLPLTGESVLYLPFDGLWDDDTCRRAVVAVIGRRASTGVWPPSGRCVVVENGVVVGVIVADPELDNHPTGRLVLHDTANIGDIVV